jgi:hypothetical protein
MLDTSVKFHINATLDSMNEVSGLFPQNVSIFDHRALWFCLGALQTVASLYSTVWQVCMSLRYFEKTRKILPILS